MAALTTTKMAVTGIDPSSYLTAAAGGGDTFVNDGNTFFHALNSDASSTNITFGAPVDVVVAVPASGRRLIGPFSTARFNDSSGNVQVSYSSVTSLTVAPVAMK